jgi:outer membrane protein insertion porin family
VNALSRAAALACLLVASAAAGQPANARASAAQPPREGSAPTVYSIAIEGAPAEDLLAGLPLQPGSPFDGRDVREAVRRLHATARFARVAAFLEQIPASELPPGFGAGVRLVFVVKLVQRLAAVSFPGRAALPDSLLHQTANLQVKTEFQPESLWRAADAIRAAYYRIGYRHVQVRPVPRDTPDGIALEMRIEEGPPTRIAELRFTGELGLTREELAAAFKLSSGDVLNLPLLEESVHGLRARYRQAGLLRARVNAPVIEELDRAHARVTVPVAAGPRVRFHIRGNRAFSDSLLLTKLGLDSAAEEPLDAQVAEEMAGRLRRFYVSAGWFGARVVQHEMRSDDGAVLIVFAVDEQQRIWVRDLRFEGNRAFRSAQLQEIVLQLLREAIPTDAYPGADPGEVARTGVMGRIPDPPKSHTRIEPTRVFDPIVYARGLRQIEDLYKSQGYLSARAGPPRLSQLKMPGQVAVTIPIVEGDRAIVSRVFVEGGPVAQARELEAALTLRKGGAFSYLAAEEGRVALTRIFTRRGYLYARVEDEETFSEQQPGDAPGVQEVRVRYRIQEGPVVRVALIEVIGHRRTKEDLIRDLIAVKVGDILTPEVLDRGQQQLLRTGLFFSATLTPLNPEVAEAEKTLQVSLRERPTVDVVVSGGFSLADGPRATVQYIQGNLLGRNLTFSAVAKADYPFIRYLQEYDHKNCTATGGALIQCEAGYQPPHDGVERVIDLGLSVPRLSPLTDKLRFGIDLIHQRSVRASYQLTKYSTQVSTGLTSRRPFDLSLQYEVGYQEFTHVNFSIEDYLAGIDPAIFRQPSGKFLLGSLRPTATLDLRDDPGRPRSGFYAQIAGDYLSSLRGSCVAAGGQTCTINLFKWQGLVAGYVPLPGLSSLLLTLHAGRVLQLDPNSETPGDRRFYLGGATKLRGFREDAVQPQDLVDSLHRQVSACQATITTFGCSAQVQALQTFGTSDGGDQFLLLNAELRVPIATSVELAVFYDAGNLWLRPRSFVSQVALRDAVGFGLRYATPIGRMAIDIAINLNPDTSFNEPRVLPYFSIDTL